MDIGLLEHCVRDDLNERAPRVMGVLHPLKLVIDNYPEDTVEEFECANLPDALPCGVSPVEAARGKIRALKS